MIPTPPDDFLRIMQRAGLDPAHQDTDGLRDAYDRLRELTARLRPEGRDIGAETMATLDPLELVVDAAKGNAG
ncbi:hypothetical protein GH722_20065 [Alphaproteobacteria bacterium HT1-32]|nr:hypothetical protein [Alphaproteobacteria bacterium HT1-32]